MYVILGKNGYIAEAFAKELSSRDVDFVSISRKDVDYLDKKNFLFIYLIIFIAKSLATIM